MGVRFDDVDAAAREVDSDRLAVARARENVDRVLRPSRDLSRLSVKVGGRRLVREKTRPDRSGWRIVISIEPDRLGPDEREYDGRSLCGRTVRG